MHSAYLMGVTLMWPPMKNLAPFKLWQGKTMPYSFVHSNLRKRCTKLPPFSAYMKQLKIRKGELSHQDLISDFTY